MARLADSLLGATADAYLVGCHAGEYPLPAQTLGATEPKVDSSCAAFAAADASADAMMWSRSKRCPACGKVNAVTMAACNGCGHAISDALESRTETVPMGFVFGVRKTEKFPLKLSLRLETEHTLVYDDPLARSTCHLNAVPSDVHIPDWRWLLTRPKAALALVRRLDDAAWQAAEACFYGDEAWRSAVVRPGALSSAADLRPHCIGALNAVVSQYQLHLHYIVPPFRPDTFHALLRGARFERGRWLPLEYVVGALEALEAHAAAHGARPGIADAPSKDSEELFAELEAIGGPSYGAAYEEAMRKYALSHEALANWRPAAFAGVATAPSGAGGPYSFAPSSAGGADTGAELSELLAADAKLLSSYGRRAEGDPAPLSYYSHARAPGGVLTAVAWSSGVEEL